MVSRLLLTAASGWLLAGLLALTIRLPFLPGRRLRLHEWLGYGIGALILAHGWVSMTRAVAGHAHGAGLQLATLALLLVVVEVMLGRGLRHRTGEDRSAARRIHFWLMVVLGALIVLHIGLDSSLFGTFHPGA